MQGATKFISLPFNEKKLFFEAVWWCAKARFVTLFFPMKWYLGLLGAPITQELNDNRSLDDTLYKIKRAVERAAKYVPWDSKCLVQAIAAKQMLKERGYVSVLFLGLAKKEKKLQAHAWLKCGNTIVTGKREMQKFTTVSMFL